jgi:A/G-specific adenine glycosylase
MMELGATICVPRDPKCLVCPVASLCEARRLGIQGELPLKRIRRETIFISRKVSVVIERGRVLLALAEGGFWELPEAVEGTQVARELGRFRHSITHHNYTFQVVEAKWSGEMPKGLSWHRLDRLHEIPLSTTAKKGIRCWREVGDAVPGEGPARV